MISHSPPIFSHSPPVSFLSDYMTNRQPLNYNDDTNRSVAVTTPASRYCRPQVITLASKAMVNNANNAAQSNALSPMEPTTIYGGGGGNMATTVNARKLTGRHNGFVVGGGGGGGFRCGLERMSSAPQLRVLPKSCLSRKSCLHKSHNGPAANAAAATPVGAATAATAPKATNQNNVITATAADEQCRSRKKVIFADDEGLSLTEVRVMSEPSNVPPYWSMKFLEQITQGLVSPHPPDQWTVDFKQPASDYLTFRQKIESEFVSLENVIVKDEESIVVGTVKVKNVEFQKEVIVRVTWDDWKSQQDIFCTYARAYGPATCAHVVFDTFSFKITLPPSSKRLEFCICYRSQDKEYWDNNNGKNYTITKRSPFYYNALAPYEKNSSSNTAQMLRQQSCQNQVMSTLTEALANSARIESAGSNWLQEPSPYW